jgi:ACS family tartrate transporter-like MFS transporter
MFQADHPWLAFLALCMTAIGIWSISGPFWSLPTSFLGGTAAAGGIALVNSLGNLGGFAGPNLIGLVKEITHHFEYGMVAMAVTICLAGLLVLRIPVEEKPPSHPLQNP